MNIKHLQNIITWCEITSESPTVDNTTDELLVAYLTESGISVQSIVTELLALDYDADHIIMLLQWQNAFRKQRSCIPD